MNEQTTGESRELGQRVVAAKVEGQRIPFEGQSEKRVFYFPAPVNMSVEANSQEEANAKVAAMVAKPEAENNNQ